MKKPESESLIYMHSQCKTLKVFGKFKTFYSKSFHLKPMQTDIIKELGDWNICRAAQEFFQFYNQYDNWFNLNVEYLIDTVICL